MQPKYVMRSLQAGKHVLSEKPIAADTPAAQHMVDVYRSRHAANTRWSVGENYRYERAFVLAASAVHQGSVGRILMAELSVHSPMASKSQVMTALPQSGAQSGFARSFTIGSPAPLVLGAKHVSNLV